MANPLLDEFGQFLMTKVRDQVIEVFDNRLDGKSKSDSAPYYARIFEEGGATCRETVRKLLPDIIDLTLHYLLWSLEESRRIHVIVKDQDGVPESLKSQSDGFPGELYTEDGWIERFSHGRRGYF